MRRRTTRAARLRWHGARAYAGRGGVPHSTHRRAREFGALVSCGLPVGCTKSLAGLSAALRGRGAAEPADVVLEVLRKAELSAERRAATPATDMRTAANLNVQDVRRQAQWTESAVAR